MRRSAIAVFCVLLVATLLSPSVAMAKGGNGRHSDSNGRATEKSRDRKSAKSQGHKSEKSQEHKSDSGKARTKAAKPKSAPARRDNNAKVAGKPVRKSSGAETVEKAEDPQAMTYEQPPSAALRTRTTLGSPVPARADEDRISAVTVDAAGVETRGVIDTIRMSTDAWLRDMLANATGIWSSFTSRFGG